MLVAMTELEVFRNEAYESLRAYKECVKVFHEKQIRLKEGDMV